LGSKPSDVTALEHFLTARWMLFSIVGARPVSARACHQPWPLHGAQAQVLEDNLLTTVGLSVRPPLRACGRKARRRVRAHAP
jgi:uncharacterized protein YqjF (DUF2071 family)